MNTVLRPIGRSAGRRHSVIVLLLILAAALLLTGCGTPVSPFWPDLSVSQGKVYVTSGQVQALQANTGEQLWSYPPAAQSSGGLFGGCSGPRITDGPFYAAPAVGERFIFMASGGERQASLLAKSENLAGLRALNEFGVVQWRFEQTEERAIASPVIDGDVVYLASSDHKVYAVDVNTQKARWTFETKGWVWAKPLVVSDTVYIASMDHVLYAIDRATGALKWKFDRAHSALPSSPVYLGGALVLTSLDGHIYAVHAETGSLVWEKQFDGGIWASPAAQDGRLYVGDLKGNLYALNAADGEMIWTTRLGGEIRSSPVWVNGKVYCGCEDGQLYALNADNGQQSLSPLPKMDKASIFTTPVYDGQYLYVVATDGQVFALDIQENTIVWNKNPFVSQEGN